MNFVNQLKAFQIYVFIVFSCVGLLSYALYTEFYLGLIPCALCMTQRAFYCLVAFTCLIALIHRPGSIAGKSVYGVTSAIWAGFGAAVAGRQVWLQSLPEDLVPACGPSLEYLFDTLPFSEAFQTLMLGDGNCAEVQWTFLSLSMPAWSLVCFSSLLLISLASIALPLNSKTK